MCAAAPARSPVWQAISSHPILFIYVIVLMTAFNCLSHGTQDNYPAFLQAQLHIGVTGTTIVTVIANVGAIVGGTFFGYSSQSWGRRRAIIAAGIVGIIMIPLWSGWLRIPGISLLLTLPLGAFLMQFMVQGAWGVIPAPLTEMSPDAIRGFYPGVTYQLGNLIAALNLPIQEAIADHHGYPAAMTWTVVPAFALVIVLSAVGKEAKGIQFGRGQAVVEPAATEP